MNPEHDVIRKRLEMPRRYGTVDAGPEFHRHLDVCDDCRDNPFDLCPVGANLIHEAAKRLIL